MTATPKATTAVPVAAAAAASGAEPRPVSEGAAAPAVPPAAGDRAAAPAKVTGGAGVPSGGVVPATVAAARAALRRGFGGASRRRAAIEAGIVVFLFMLPLAAVLRPVLGLHVGYGGYAGATGAGYAADGSATGGTSWPESGWPVLGMGMVHVGLLAMALSAFRMPRPAGRRPLRHEAANAAALAGATWLGASLAHLARLDGEPLDLTRTEFGLLHLLLRNRGRAFSREYLRDAVWGEPVVDGDRSVDNAILRLRKKLGPLGDWIETVWGVGYRLRAQP
jgi:hypothetical protein